MNRALYRTNSAGGGVNQLGIGSRPSSGKRPVSGRADNNENRALREQVSYLQHELLLSQAEAKKVTDQLNCLVELIKSAWTGDKSANVHVANIVGVAPPDLIETNSGINNVTLVTKPKSRAINHWAVLTIGLLNREYRRIEKELEAKQLCYFHRRQDYLEEQLLLNRDQMIRLTQQSVLNPDKSRVSSATTRPNHSSEQYRQPQKSAPQERHCTSPVEAVNGQLEAVQAHHYGWQQMSGTNRINVNKPPSVGPQRKTSAKYRKPKEADPEVDLTWADLVIEPLHGQKINKATNMTMDGLYRLPKQTPENEKGQGLQAEEYDEDRIHLTYDDPHRYVQNGIFNVGEALGAEATCRSKRPLSGQLRQADSLRSRPRSAVVKQERPLKFETTRPISAPKSKTSLLNNSHRESNLTPKTKQPKQTEKVAFERNLIQTPSGAPQSRTGSARMDQKANNKKAEAAALVEGLKMRKARLLQEDPELADLINVDVTQPECIKEFDDELLEMHTKETDFKKRAVELQKKLGINPGGILYPDL